MYQAKFLDEKDIPKFQYIKDLCGYNELPTPHKIIDWHEYFHLAQTEVMDFTDTRQIFFVGKTKLHTVRKAKLSFGHTYGLAVVMPADWHLESGKMKWSEEPLYVRLGCNHEWKECSLDWCQANKVPHYGKCYHVYHCDDCDMTMAQDSSD